MADAAVVNPARTAVRPYAYYVLAILFLVSVTNYFDRFMLGILQESMKHDLGLRDTQLGIISGPAFAIFYTVAGIPVARLADRINRATLLSFAVAFWSAATAFCGFGQNFAQLALCRLGVGMGEGGAMPMSHSIVSEYFPSDRRGAALSILMAGGPIAAMLTPIAGALIAETWGWRAAFWACAIPGVLLVILIKTTLKDPRAGSAAAAAEPRGHLVKDLGWFFRNPVFLLLVASAAFNGMATTGLGAFEISYIIRTFSFDLKVVGASVGSLAIFALAGVLLSGFLADRFAGKSGRSYYYLPAVTSGIAGVAFIVAYTSHSWPMTFAALALGHSVWQMTNGPSVAAVQNITPPRLRATGSALFMFGATAVGAGFGPLSVGLISDMAGAAAYVGPGLFSVACHAPHVAHGAPPPVLSEACAAASAGGLRTAQLSVATLYFVAMALSFITGRISRPPTDVAA